MKHLLNTILILFLFSPGKSIAQEKKSLIDIPLRHAIEQGKADNQPLRIYATGNTNLIRKYIKENEGYIYRVSGNIVDLSLPAGKIEPLSKEDFVKSIEFDSYKGTLLNDTMKYNNKVIPAHNGDKPLPSSYKGDGILMGFIDSGIDFKHDDFNDSTGNTRIINIWDQTQPFDPGRTPAKYGYGQVWDSTSINNGQSTHTEPPSNYGHGTMVTGVAASDGSAVGNFSGVAPNSKIVMVASDFSSSNWLGTVVDATEFIYKLADSLNMPCVINASVGTYGGSHDALDASALMIDSMVRAKPGRSFVAAAGNAGKVPYHMGYNITSDTNFTWFEYNSNTLFGFGAVYFEAWSDTADFNNVQFAVGADQTSPSYNYRGRTPFQNIQTSLYNLYKDSIVNGNGDVLAHVETYATQVRGRYKLQVMLKEPDSSSYNFRFITTGSGRVDVWSASWLGTSNMVKTGLPNSTQLPDIVNYKAPDTAQTIVSSFSCLESVLTVGTYVNRDSYIDVNGTLRTFSVTPGAIGANSSIGPTRDNRQKPDLTASGDYILTSGDSADIAKTIANGQSGKIAQGGMHKRNGGTSMASPIVAGTAALYLEKCPGADFQEIINAVNTTAFPDSFTTTVPNDRWGNGKLHAFDALTNSNFKPIISASSLTACADTTITLLGQSGLKSWTWNTGDTTINIQADSSGDYYYTAENSSLCKANSDTLNLNFYPLPGKPNINLNSDTLYTDSTAISYQWFKNNNQILGANDSFYVFSQTGSYFLRITDQNGCNNYTDTLSLTSIKEYKKSYKPVIYPNPSKFLVYIEQAVFIFEEIKLISPEGRVVLSKNPEKRGDISIDVSGFSRGLYLLSIRAKKGYYYQKLIIE